MMRRGGSDLRPPAICRPDLGWEEPAERRLGSAIGLDARCSLGVWISPMRR